jgi:serine/threonine-protein kinase
VSRPDLSGTTVGGHFVLKKRLGSGHFGDVYLCDNTMMAHVSALKVVPIDPANSNTPELEAQLLNLSHHAHIVKVRSAAVWEDSAGHKYLLIEMEYVPGGSLEDAIKREIPLGELVSLMKNVSFGLDHAHPTVIHRDVKPANILLGGGGQLSDFGIAMVAATGASVSNLQYVLNRAPECFPPTATYDVSTDIFAAGLTLFRAVNLIANWKGTLLTAFGSPGGVLSRMQAGTLVDGLAFHPRVPKRLQKVVKTACAKQPSKRYPTAAAFRDALEGLKIARDWRRIAPDTWECLYNGSSEQLIITSKGTTWEVDYRRNGRRKTARHRAGLSQGDALKYVYQLIAETTLSA